VSHPSQTPRPRHGEPDQYAGYGYGGQPVDPGTGTPVPPPGYRYEPGYPPFVPIPRKGNGLAISSLVLGIVGVMLSWIPVVGYFAFIIGIVGFVLGAIGIFKSHRIMSITGVVLNTLAIVFSVIAFASLMSDVDKAVNDYNAAVEAAPELTAPSLSAPAGGIEDELEGEAEANADVVDDTPNSDNGWVIEHLDWPTGSAYTFAELTLTNTEPSARTASVEVAVFEDEHLIGTLYGVTNFDVPGNSSDTLVLLPADITEDPFDHEPTEANLTYVLTTY
jgi:hypothetical protein